MMDGRSIEADLDEVLLPNDDLELDTSSWATVTQLDPLRVRLDGETAPLSVTPQLACGPVANGAHVWVRLVGKRVIVLGPPASATETARGLVELATVAEALAGTDTTRAVTPAGLFAVSPSTPQIGEWGGKSGPTSLSSAYKNVWATGRNSLGTPVSINALYSTTQIQILQTGQYEVEAYQRAAGASTGYLGIALNGDRAALEASRTTGIWTHDHSGGANNFSRSKYIGLLNAGELITAGGAGSTDLSYASASSTGVFIVKRIG